MRRALLISALGLASVLTACATSHVIVGTPRPPIAPDQVKVYLHPPAKFEEIAILDSSSKGSFAFTSQAKMDAVIQRLKEDAAKLGANGILLQSEGNQYAGSVSTGTGMATASGNTAWGVGTGFSGAAYNKAATGLAIYVTAE